MELVNFDLVWSMIDSARILAFEYKKNYIAKGHRTTAGLLNQLITEYDLLTIMSHDINPIINHELSWVALYRITQKLIDHINFTIKSLLPLIPDNETNTEYIHRKLNMKSFQRFMPSSITNLKILCKIFSNIMYLKNNEERMTFENCMTFVKEFYIYPFWYDLDNDLYIFRDLMNLFKSTFLNGHIHQPILKPFGMLGGMASNLYNKMYSNYTSTKESFNEIKKYESIELLQYMWNQGESGLGSTAVGLLLPNIAVAEWVKLVRYVDLEPTNIQCLLLSNKTLPFRIPDNLIIHDQFLNCIQADTKKDINVILHMHGGGFVSGSPRTHECYLREWALNTNTIILSVNYTKSPQVRFPYALEECYYVYKLLSEGTLFGIVPKKIILAGDSAGGNLAITTIIMAINNKIRIPDGLILAYPAVDCCKTVTLSKHIFSYDILLSYNLLLLCSDAYIPDNFNPKYELISPLYVHDDILSQFPDNIFIHSATYCPLLDDSLKFVTRLRDCKKNVRQWLFDLPHGFWNMGSIIPSVASIIKQTNSHINMILQ